MRALITGAGGQLAGHLVATAPPGADLLAVKRAECDITDQQAVEKVFGSFDPDLVINTAAFTAVDAAEDDRDLAFRVNAQGVENVARSAAAKGAKLIHISTDYVFDGNRATPYPPDAPTNPLSTYGASKLEGERLALAAWPETLVVRVGWLYSKTGRNFLSKIAGGAFVGQRVRVVRDQVGCPTSAREFATALWQASTATLSGVYHWSNSGATTWFDFAMERESLARELGLSGSEVTEIVGVPTGELPSRATRPRYSVLDPKLLADALDLTPALWTNALRAELLRAI